MMFRAARLPLFAPELVEGEHGVNNGGVTIWVRGTDKRDPKDWTAVLLRRRRRAP